MNEFEFQEYSLYQLYMRDRSLTTKPCAGWHQVSRRPIHVAHLWVVAVQVEVAEVVRDLPWGSLVHRQLKDWVGGGWQVVLGLHEVQRRSIVGSLVA